MGVLLLRRVDVVRMHEERGAPWRPVLQTDADAGVVDPPFQRAVPSRARVHGLSLGDRVRREVALEQRELHGDRHDGAHLPAARGAFALDRTS